MLLTRANKGSGHMKTDLLLTRMGASRSSRILLRRKCSHTNRAMEMALVGVMYSREFATFALLLPVNLTGISGSGLKYKRTTFR